MLFTIYRKTHLNQIIDLVAAYLFGSLNTITQPFILYSGIFQPASVKFQLKTFEIYCKSERKNINNELWTDWH